MWDWTDWEKQREAADRLDWYFQDPQLSLMADGKVES